MADGGGSSPSPRRSRLPGTPVKDKDEISLDHLAAHPELLQAMTMDEVHRFIANAAARHRVEIAEKDGKLAHLQTKFELMSATSRAEVVRELKKGGRLKVDADVGEEVFQGFEACEVDRSYSDLVERHEVDGGQGVETTKYHPLAKDLFSSLISDRLCLKHENRVPSTDQCRPDFVIGDKKEDGGAISWATMATFLEIKTRRAFSNQFRSAKAQALDCAFKMLRARYVQKSQGDAERGNDAFALGALTDLETIVFFRVGLCELPGKRGAYGKQAWHTVNIPLDGDGLVWLNTLLNATPEKLGVQASTPLTGDISVNGKTIALGSRLGMGTFAEVYAVDAVDGESADVDGESLVLKLGRQEDRDKSDDGRQRIECETRILRKFDGSSPYLPKCRLFDADKHILVMSPRGIPLTEAFQRLESPEEQQRFLRTVLRNVLSALRTAHQKSVYHLDIRIDNIVWVEDKDDDNGGRAVLIDWGCGWETDEGATDYYARRIGNSKWLANDFFVGADDDPEVVEDPGECKVSPLHDLEMLAYAIFAIPFNGDQPWRPGKERRTAYFDHPDVSSLKVAKFRQAVLSAEKDDDLESLYNYFDEELEPGEILLPKPNVPDEDQVEDEDED